jgi:mRNA interferase MazF
MRRGDIRLVDFEPARGSEASKRRPAVIVSNDGANAIAARLGRGVLTVVPVTSNTRHVYPFQVLLPSADTGLQLDSKAQAEQIRSVAIERIGGQIGRMPPMLMNQLDEALRLHLELLRLSSRPLLRSLANDRARHRHVGRNQASAFLIRNFIIRSHLGAGTAGHSASRTQ